VGIIDRVKDTHGISLAHIMGIASIIISAVLTLWQWEWAAVPLGFYVFLCFIAPFFPRFSFFLPIVSRGETNHHAVALTFDDGPDPSVTPALLHLLEEKKVSATFFVTGENAVRHPALIRRMREEGHEIGNHSYSHHPFLMLCSKRRMAQEISSVQALLAGMGIRTFAFRPPVGITNPKLYGILRDYGLFCVNFSCRAVDFGNRQINGLARKMIAQAKAGDIVLLHDIRPAKEESPGAWLQEVVKIIDGLGEKGLRTIPLSQLIGRQIMVLEKPTGDTDHD
jgi:peptidoglycan-N-acetylglucosamine deacetylase